MDVRYLYLALLLHLWACNTIGDSAVPQKETCSSTIGEEDLERQVAFARCDYLVRCSISESIGDCYEAWEANSPSVGNGGCKMDGYDACAAEACLLKMATEPPDCGEDFLYDDECEGAWTRYECVDW